MTRWSRSTPRRRANFGLSQLLSYLSNIIHLCLAEKFFSVVFGFDLEGEDWEELETEEVAESVVEVVLVLVMLSLDTFLILLLQYTHYSMVVLVLPSLDIG
jgi:hypothetical protein